MDKAALIHRRKKRYMAQAMAVFEKVAEPHLTPEAAEEVKGIIRRKMHALALDACEVLQLAPGEEMNVAALELRDQMHIEGRPQRSHNT